MDFPELHRRYERTATYELKPPLRPGGVPRRGDLFFRPLTAYKLETGKLVKTTIWEKANQNFWAYATAFEKEWSKLADLKNALDPVVDQDLTVVGHVGRVDGGSILVPKGQSLTADLPDRLLKAGIPFFVGRKSTDESWERFAPSKSGEGAALTVVTGVDGRVLAAANIRQTGAGAVAEDFSILDLVFIVKGLADLGAAAGKAIVRGLASKRAAAAMSGAAKVIIFTGATREVALEAASRGAAQALKRTTVYVRETGMTAKHFAAFQEAAKEAKVIAIVRNTNPASTKLIELGCPGKPLFFKFHTSETTGIVMARNADEVAKVWAREYWVVGFDGVARREVLRNGKRVMEKMETKGAFWKVEQGQVIDPVTKRPLVGDYDLMGIIDPSSPGRNIVLVAKEGETVSDAVSPIVKKFTDKINPKLDRPRVLHGAQDQYSGYRGGAAAFHPDGTVTYLPDEAAVKRFYEAIGRETRTGAYAQPPGAPVVDELAARRARK